MAEGRDSPQKSFPASLLKSEEDVTNEYSLDVTESPYPQIVALEDLHLESYHSDSSSSSLHNYTSLTMPQDERGHNQHRVIDFVPLKSRFDVCELNRRIAQANKRENQPTSSSLATGSVTSTPKEFPEPKVQRMKKFQTLVEECVPLIYNKMTDGLEFMLVTGCTGSGKSTMVPLAALKLLRSDEKLVIVTVPKRVAAQMLFNRQTINAKAIGLNGCPIGYAMYKDSVRSSNTRLLYVTAGWLLVLLSNAPNAIFSFSTVIVDECHERGADTELLIGLLHKLQQKYKNKRFEESQLQFSVAQQKYFPRLAFLSATMDAKKMFLHFRGDTFFNESGYKRGSCLFDNVLLDIESPMNDHYKVTELFLEELGQEPYGIRTDSALREFMIGDHIKIRPIVPKVQIAVIDVLLETLDKLCSMKVYSSGNALVFVPGIFEMGMIIRRYNESLVRPKKFEFVLFHSKLTPEEKNDMKCAANGKVCYPRKILLATNIAESSITIPNLSIVIDFGLTKLTTFDHLTDCQTLVLHWTDKMSLQQRRGRAGRDRDAIYVYLGSLSHYTNLSPNPSDVERESLDDLVMKLLEMGENNAFKSEPNFLQDFIMHHMLNHPDLLTLGGSIANLLSNYSIVQSSVDPFTCASPSGGFTNLKLTEGGRIISLFPTLKRNLCLLIHIGGKFFQNTETVAYMAASDFDDLNEVFLHDDTYATVHRMKLRHSFGEPSDVKALLGLFKSWQKSQYLQRNDGLKKKSLAPTEPLRGFGVAERNRDLEEWELKHVNVPILTRMDDNAAEIFKILATNNIKIIQSQEYKRAINSAYQDMYLPSAKLNERIICNLLPALTSPFKTWFFSSPSFIRIGKEKDKDLFLPNVLFLTPAPPLNFDLEKYGSVIQEHFSKGFNQYPDIFIDQKRNRIILTYPYCGRELYLGRCHPGVINALISHANRQGKKDKDIIINYEKLRNPPKAPTELPVFVEPEKINIDSNTRINICNFINPYCFFVRKADSTQEIQAFQDLFWMLHKASKQGLRKITIEQAIIGTTCILLKPGSKEPPGLNDPKKKIWNHHHRRAIIRSYVGKDIEGIPAKFKSHYKVLVESIDMGDFGFYELDNLFFFDSKTCNYGQSDLFSKFPRLAYRCVLDSVLPVGCNGWNWPTEDVYVMSKELKDKEKHFKSLGYLKVKISSKEDHIIVCNDILNSSKNFSFKQWILDNNYAVENDTVQIVDLRKRPFGPFYLPHPSNSPVMPTSLQKQVKMSEEDDQFNMYFITDVYSPLQVNWTPCTNSMRSIGKIEANTSTMNSHFLDPRITVDNLEENYDPLLLVASELRYYPNERDEHKCISIDSSTVFQPIPGLISILAMLIQPVVTVYIDESGKIFALDVFKTMHNGEVEHLGHIQVKVIISIDDITTIDKWRNNFNSFLVCGDGANPETLRRVLLSFLKTNRRPINVRYPEFFGEPQYGKIDPGRCIQNLFRVVIQTEEPLT